MPRMDWKAFLRDIEKDPRSFVRAVVKHLDPPKYALELLRNMEWLCGWPGCWNPIVDACVICSLSMCGEHLKEYVGPKTELLWYACQACREVEGEEAILMRIAQDDEQVWIDEQEEVP